MSAAPTSEESADFDRTAAAVLSMTSQMTEEPTRTIQGEIPLIDASGVENRERAFRAVDGRYHVRNVTVPSLIPYLPDPEIATGSAALVAPGGGFRMLSMDAEGHEVAEWLRSRGVAAFVLKYRLRHTGDTHEEFAEDLVASLLDAARTGSSASTTAPTEPAFRASAVADVTTALDVIRERAEEWNIDAHRVGAVGFSAGAYVLTWALTNSAERLNALACIYGGHVDSSQLPDTAPPLFAAVGARDALCASDVLTVVEAWRSKNLSVEAHLYDSDAHGFGIVRLGLPTDAWSDRFEEWLARIAFLDVVPT